MSSLDARLSDFATGPSPFPDTPWQEAQDRRNSFRPGFSSGCACRTSIVPIIVETAAWATVDDSYSGLQ
jgi:hypothetical protein